VPQCFQCEQENPPGQAFCGFCGSPLVLREFIAAQVNRGIASAIQNRDVLETESSIKVFQRAWDWVKVVLGVAAVLFAIVGGGVVWKVSDWWSGVNQAKQVVAGEAENTRSEIGQTSAKAVSNIQAASSNAVAANAQATQNATKLSGELNQTVTRTKSELAKDAASVRDQLASSQTALQDARKLQPEFDSMRAQLGKATSDLAAQQKVISSSEDFVKAVFSSHTVSLFLFDQFVKPNSIVDPGSLILLPGSNDLRSPTTVYMLLPSAPIPGTLQLQYYIYVQPPNSYTNIHNLVLFSWADPADNLKQKQMSVSYFPDSSDKDLIHTLSERDGRVFADDQPMPKLNQPDPDFKGNKWIPVVPPPASAPPAPAPRQSPR
jgi:hypothetical protein